MATGERLVNRYLKHPPASSGPLADGDPLDSGTAMLVHSNLSHLAERNVRLIGHTVGPGDISYDSTITLPWGQTIDEAQSDGDIYAIIPWERPACAVNFGPLALAHTRLGTAPAGYYPRKVRVIVQAYKNNVISPGSVLIVFAVLTAGAGTPIQSTRLAQFYQQRTQSTPGAHTFDITLSPDQPLRPNGEWRSRPDSADAPAGVSLVEGWLWIGWHTDCASTPDRVESISAFEVWT
jgi:hypothetical protein